MVLEMATRYMNKGVVENGGFGHEMPHFDGICRDQRLLLGKNSTFKSVQGKEENGFVKNLVENVCNSDDESSSIGNNSDASENSLVKSGKDGEEEVQSSCRGPLDCMVDLEEVLPIRRGISAFYNGKSKSFASLSDASSSSIKELAKPEQRKNRGLLAYNRLSWDKTRLKNCAVGISKRVTNSTRTSTTLALGVAMNCNNSENIDKQLHSMNGSLCAARKDFTPWRSFSFADLQQCASRPSNLSRLGVHPS